MPKKKDTEKVQEIKPALSNDALKDIESVMERPEFTPEEFEVIDKATPWMKSLLRPELRLELEKIYQEKYDTFREEMNAQSRAQVTEMMDEWKRSQDPLSEKDLQKLLSKEYVTFDVTVKGRKGQKDKTFTLCELPKESEDKFLASLQKHLVPIVEQFNAAEMRSALKTNFTEQVVTFLGAVPKALTAACEICAVCLDPWNEDDDIDAEWVAQNLSIYRIVLIIRGQCEVNHYRNFFSDGSRLFRM